VTSLDAKKIIERISYKPGWTLGMETNGKKLTLKVFTPTLIDVNQSSFAISLTFTWPSVHVDCLRGQTALLMWVRHCLEATERHEMYEWFRLDGQQVFNPHATDPNIPVW